MRPGGARAPPGERPAHRPRERRRPVRPRQLRRVRPAGGRRPAPPARARRPDPPHAGRRDGRRRRPVDGRQHRCVMSYDYTVLAGTQGLQNHRKKDRLFELAERSRLPVVFFAEGGGGRPGRHRRRSASPGSTAWPSHLFGGLSGLVPLVGITSGRCFAGNAALLGCCDVIIATADANIGMGGPAMIEGGGLGVYAPEEIGPIAVQVPNGVVDIAWPTRPRPCAVARQYLVVLPGRRSATWDVRRPAPAAPRHPREPAARLRRARRASTRWPTPTRCSSCAASSGRAWSPPRPHRGPADRHRRQQPDPPRRRDRQRRRRQGGALHAAVRRLRPARSCSCATRRASWSGPRPRQTALGPPRQPHVRDRRQPRPCRSSPSSCARATASAPRRWPAAASRRRSSPSSWPTGEFGGMGLEGAVRLGYRNELEAIEDPAEREALVRRDGRAAVRARQGGQHRHALRDRRRHRPGRLAPLDHGRARRRAGAAAAATARSAPCIDTW